MPDSRPLWRNRDFMLLWSGQAVSTLGTRASQVVYPLLILALTGSPARAGVAGALYAVPYVVFSLPVGALIDRWDRKRVMVSCDVGRAVTLASIPIAMLLGALTVWQLYACALVEGSLFVLFNIAEAAALPRVVERDKLPEAAAQNEVAWGVADITGPALGTFLYQTLGRAAPFIADGISYLVSVASLVFIRTGFQGDRGAGPQRGLWHAVGEGMRWLWSRPLIRYMAVLTGGLNLVSAAAPLLVIVLAKATGAQDAQIGLVFSIGGIGGILGSFLGGQAQKRFSFGTVIIGSTWIMALAFPLYAVAPGFMWLGLVSAVSAMMSPVYNVTQYSYRLALIPDELQGRVNSTFRLLAFGFNPIGAAVSGVAIERIGAAPTALAFGAVLIVLAALTTANRHVRTAAPIADACA